MSAIVGQVAAEAAESPALRALRSFGRRPLAMVGLAVVLVFVLAALLAPWIAPYDPLQTSWTRLRQPPSWAHPFGTDENGRDVLSRVLWGARASLMAGVISVMGALAIGVPIGLLAGLGGRFLDAVISRIADAMLSVPFLILAIALAAFLGPALENAMLAIAITASPVFVRLTRGMALDAKSTDWVEAARSLGNSDWRIGIRHVLPNIIPPLLVQASLAIAEAIIAEASLSFLGLGQQPPAPSWGSMLNSAQRFLTQAPWLAIFPGLAIFLVVLAFNLVGDGLRDALDPAFGQEVILFHDAPGRLRPGRRIYAIGDIHGSLDKLRALHGLIARDMRARPGADALLIHLGDYVDKAGDARGVVDYLASGDPVPGLPTKNLTGNHEETMLAALDGQGGAAADWLWGGGKATLESWGLDPEGPRDVWPAAFTAAQLAFLRGLDLFHEEEGYLFVHAGIRPGIPLAEQTREDMLRIRHDFLNSARDHGFVVVHGHTAGFAPVMRPNRICVDTAAWSGGKLTCAVVEEDRVGFLGA